MEKYQDMMAGIISLTDTMEQGMAHVQKVWDYGANIAAKTMLRDVLEAYIQVEKAIALFIHELPVNMIQEYHEQLRLSLDELIRALEEQDPEWAAELLEKKVSLSFQQWKNELSRCLGPYLPDSGAKSKNS